MEIKFLKRSEVAAMLGITPRSFDRIKPKLVALYGFKEITIGRSIRYVESDITSFTDKHYTSEKAAKLLCLSLRSFNRFKHDYISKRRLKEVSIGRCRFYTKSSLEKMVQRAVYKRKGLEA